MTESRGSLPTAGSARHSLGAAAALLFDLDGVLIESKEVWFRVLNAVADELGCPAVLRDAFEAGWGQGVEADVTSFFSGHRVERIAERYDVHFPALLEFLEVAPDVEEVFAVLSRRRIPSAVITNTPNPLASRLVEHAAARPDLVVGGTDVVRAKPAPDMVLAACRELAVAPADAWVVGDSGFDRDAAAAAGAGFVGFRMPGDLTVGSLAELAALLGASGA
jgi:HAD superfamily hydrolase (TIGR01549 family)